MEQQSGIMDAIFGGLKRAGEVGIDLGKTVAQIPMSVVTAIPDFAKDPEVFLSGGREDALAALLSPDFRKRRKADLDAAREFRKLEQGKQAVDWVQGLFQGVPMDQRANVAQVAEQGGATSEMVEQGLSFANQQDQARQQAVGMLAPSVGADTAEALLSADPTIAKAATLKARLDANRQKQSEIAARAAESAARTGRRMTLAERREARLAAQPAAATPEQRLDRELAERGAKSVFDQTAETTTQQANALASTITDPAMGGPLLAQVPTFSARAAKRAAQKFIEEQTPLTSRKNVFRRKKAKESLDEKVKSLPQTTGLDSAILSDAPLPTDPAERLAEAEKLGTALLAAGFPPDKAAAELLRRGFTAEELPE